MTFRGKSYRSVMLNMRKQIAVAALCLASGLFGGSALTETPDDNFGNAVSAYRAGKHSQALEMWRGLADEGNALAQFNVGLLHYKGHGATRSYAQALIWFHAAARQGLAVSYLRLGTMFERGEGVPHDLEQAYLWYTLAVSAFGPGPCRDQALEGRRSLAKNLTEAQVLKVLAESSEWAPGPLGGVGQPCFDTIAVRPVDGMERSTGVAKKRPAEKDAKANSAAAATAAKPNLAKRGKHVARADATEAPDIRDAKPAAETTVMPPAKPETRVQTLMTKLPAKMPNGTTSAMPQDRAAQDSQYDGGGEQASSLPVVDVAKRKVHTVKPAGSGKIPLVGTSPRPSYNPKNQRTAAEPAPRQLPVILMQPAEREQPDDRNDARDGDTLVEAAPGATAESFAPPAPAPAGDQPRREKKLQRKSVKAQAPAMPSERTRMPAERKVASPAAGGLVMPMPNAPKQEMQAAETVPDSATPIASTRKPDARKATRPAGNEETRKKRIGKKKPRDKATRLARLKQGRVTPSYAAKQTVYVQLGALSTRRMADNVWRRLQTENKDIIDGHQRLIVKFHAADGRVLYRLYAGPFDNGGKADAFCNSLKRRSEACFVPPKFREPG